MRSCNHAHKASLSLAQSRAVRSFVLANSWQQGLSFLVFFVFLVCDSINAMMWRRRKSTFFSTQGWLLCLKLLWNHNVLANGNADTNFAINFYNYNWLLTTVTTSTKLHQRTALYYSQRLCLFRSSQDIQILVAFPYEKLHHSEIRDH